MGSSLVGVPCRVRFLRVPPSFGVPKQGPYLKGYYKGSIILE